LIFAPRDVVIVSSLFSLGSGHLFDMPNKNVPRK
jgi:hypothetical protein